MIHILRIAAIVSAFSAFVTAFVLVFLGAARKRWTSIALVLLAITPSILFFAASRVPPTAPTQACLVDQLEFQQKAVHFQTYIANVRGDYTKLVTDEASARAKALSIADQASAIKSPLSPLIAGGCGWAAELYRILDGVDKTLRSVSTPHALSEALLDSELTLDLYQARANTSNQLRALDRDRTAKSDQGFSF